MSSTPANRTQPLNPSGWADARGYSHGLVIPAGRLVVLAGQVGWNSATQQFETDDLAGQVRQALGNIVSLLAHAGAEPTHLVRLTWYVTDRDAYFAARQNIGRAYRELIGAHYPPMTVVFVTGLVDVRATVEIEATAVVPDP